MADTEQPDDNVAMRLCINGQREAFGILVKRYMKRAIYTALALVGNPDDALDLSQDTIIRAFRSIEAFRPNMKFYTWYYTILRNLCINHLRNKQKRPTALTEIKDLARLPDRDSDPSVLAEENELNSILWTSINSLDPPVREIIILKDFQRLTYREIADVLNVPMGTVMSRLYYARKRLREKERKASIEGATILE